MQRLVPRALVPFLAAHADVDVVTAERRSADSVRLLDEGRADLGVVIADPAWRPWSRRPTGSPTTPSSRSAPRTACWPGGARSGSPRWPSTRWSGSPRTRRWQQTMAANLGDSAPLVRFRGRAVGLDDGRGAGRRGGGARGGAPPHRRPAARARRRASSPSPGPAAPSCSGGGSTPGPDTDDLAEHLRRAAHDRVQASPEPKAGFADRVSGGPSRPSETRNP